MGAFVANLLTAVRLLLVAPIAILVARGGARSAAIAAVGMAAAIATDLADGPIARRTGTVSALGGTLDHLSDFLLVTAGLSAAAGRGAVPWVLPALITAAFAQYWIDSYWVYRGRALRGSRLGRYNGILYFVPLCGVILIELGLTALGPLLAVAVWALVVSTLASMGQRLMLARKALASPAAETAGQFRR